MLIQLKHYLLKGAESSNRELMSCSFIFRVCQNHIISLLRPALKNNRCCFQVYLLYCLQNGLPRYCDTTIAEGRPKEIIVDFTKKLEAVSCAYLSIREKCDMYNNVEWDWMVLDLKSSGPPSLKQDAEEECK